MNIKFTVIQGTGLCLWRAQCQEVVLTDLQHAFYLEGEAGGEAEVQLHFQGGLTVDAAGADHAATPHPGPAPHLLETSWAAGQINADTLAADTLAPAAGWTIW